MSPHHRSYSCPADQRPASASRVVLAPSWPVDQPGSRAGLGDRADPFEGDLHSLPRIAARPLDHAGDLPEGAHPEGHGLGAGLLQDVIARTNALGSEIGCRGLLVHAETAEASPTDPLHLFLLMKDIRRTLS